MQIVSTVATMRAVRSTASGPVGFLPTMGALHDGHLSHLRAAQNDGCRVVSIFVNPTQFGPGDDFAAYPRDLVRDLELLEAAGADIVFTPAPDELYPPGADTWVQPGSVAERLEGARRPGHFRGVATIVASLFNIVQPDRAYFGQKDIQQVTVIGRMVRDLHIPVELVVGETVREPDGLAMSSRNAYLGDAARAAAPGLYRALDAARTAFRRGQTDSAMLLAIAEGTVRGQPLLQLDYVSIDDPETMRPTTTARPGDVMSIAVRLGRTHLIDNVILT